MTTRDELEEDVIKAWTRKFCHKCGRERTHYRMSGRTWKCIGKLPGTAGKLVAKCGDKVLGGVER